MAKSSKSYRVLRRSLVTAAKERPCTDCYGVFHPFVMDLDHVRGSKSFNCSKVSHSIDRVLEEIAKCDVVCANCHRIRTYNRMVFMKELQE